MVETLMDFSLLHLYLLLGGRIIHQLHRSHAVDFRQPSYLLNECQQTHSTTQYHVCKNSLHAHRILGLVDDRLIALGAVLLAGCLVTKLLAGRFLRVGNSVTGD